MKEEQEAVVRRELQKRELILKDKVSLPLTISTCRNMCTMHTVCNDMNSVFGNVNF